MPRLRVMGHANIERTWRIYGADLREAEERKAIVLRQFAEARSGSRAKMLLALLPAAFRHRLAENESPAPAGFRHSDESGQRLGTAL
jgi:hypothetical protein